MQLDLNEIIPNHFDASSTVWIYQSNRRFTLSEAFELETMFEQFTLSWNSHGVAITGFATLLYGQFIVIVADTTKSKVSGCSTDSSVHFIQSIQQKFKVDLLDRQHLAFYIKEKVELLPLAHVNHAIQNGFIDADTLYFNNLVNTKEALINNWLIPVKQSLLSKKLQAAANV